MGSSSVHVMGHSMGGMLGYALLDRSIGAELPVASLTGWGAPLIPGGRRPAR